MQHLDEGTIHAWLDGALPGSEGSEIERHVAECEACAALVAEARGFVAAASRILTSLDDVPAGVIPTPGTDQRAASKGVQEIPPRLGRRTARPWWRRSVVAAAAAVAFVAIGTLSVVSRGRLQKARTEFSDTARQPAASVASTDSLVTLAERRETTPPLPLSPKVGTEGGARAAAAPDRNAAKVSTPVPGAPPAPALAAGKTEREPRPAEFAATSAATAPPSRKADSVARLQLNATPAGAVANMPRQADRAAEAAMDRRTQASVTQAQQAVAGAADVAKARRDQAEGKVNAATLRGCYSLQLVGVGKGPMAIAAVRLPTHIRLDTTSIAGTTPQQYAARDISPPGERVDNTYHWRPTGPDTFELIVIRDGAVQTFPAGIGAAGTTAEGQSKPMPAGAPVRLAAVVEACR